eukprot:2857121-Rhodomonas_salina.3
MRCQVGATSLQCSHMFCEDCIQVSSTSHSVFLLRWCSARVCLKRVLGSDVRHALTVTPRVLLSFCLLYTSPSPRDRG